MILILAQKYGFYKKGEKPFCLKKKLVVNCFKFLKMKQLYFLICLHSFSICLAQDPQLFENTWYLQNVIVDGQDNFPPSNDEVPFVTITFMQNNSVVSTYVCDSIEGTVVYNNSQFLVDGWSMTLGGCWGPFEQENTLFQGIYLDTFFVGNVDDPFSYNIFDDSNSKTLVITSASGDEAIYSNQLLSRDNFEISIFTIHPNPAKSNLFITGQNTAGNLKVKIFNIEGKLLSVQNLEFEKQVSVDVSSLSSGIYFLDIEDRNGNKAVKKFIKN